MSPDGAVPGVFDDSPIGRVVEAMSAEEYHAPRVGVVSKSALDQIHRSPAHYRAWLEGKLDRPDSRALTFGRAFHCAVLEPDVFARSYAVQPDFGDCRFKEAKQARDRWRAENDGKEFVSADDFEAIRAMATSVLTHPIAGKMLKNGKPELTIKWTDVETGLPCKCRADYYVASRGMILDVKTTEDARPEAFKRSVYQYRYHVQDALYRAGFAAAGLDARYFILVAVEKSPPFCASVYQLDASAVEKGHAAARQDIETMARCVATNQWDGYPTSIQDLSLPPWAA